MLFGGAAVSSPDAEEDFLSNEERKKRAGVY